MPRYTRPRYELKNLFVPLLCVTTITYRGGAADAKSLDKISNWRCGNLGVVEDQVKQQYRGDSMKGRGGKK